MDPLCRSRCLSLLGCLGSLVLSLLAVGCGQTDSPGDRPPITPVAAQSSGQALPISTPQGSTFAGRAGLGPQVNSPRTETTASGEQVAQNATTPPPGEKTSSNTADPPEKTEAKTQPAKEPIVLVHPFPDALPSPSLSGGVEWLNVDGPLDLKDLRGKFVILDFWTYCCINCMHILPELKKLEHAYPNLIVVIGVHSAKFTAERGTENIREAILRYRIEHPVVNDANMKIWENFGCHSWPSLRVIDPQGKLVAGHGGEIEFETLDGFLKEVVPYYRAKGLLDERPLHFNVEKFRMRKESPLFFPGKVLADEPHDRLFIADSSHDRIVVTSLTGKLLDTIGSGQSGLKDGTFATAQFHDPQGMALKDDLLYVADNGNHALRKVNLKTKEVQTIAGTGQQRRGSWPGLDMNKRDKRGQVVLPERFVERPAGALLNSPWALMIHDSDLFIAMAGPHQIWKMPLDESEIGIYAGNGREDIVNGPLVPDAPYEEGFSSFAQPSGLAADGDWFYVTDSEGSSIRAVPFDPTKSVKTILGTDQLPGGRLFEFGDIDGKYPAARLQHPLGIVKYDGKVYIADTYNNKIKVLDVKDQSVTTLAGTGKAGKSDNPAQFDEPAEVTGAAGKLYVADTNNHLIRVIDLKTKAVSTLAIPGLVPPPEPELESAVEVAAGNKLVELKPAQAQVKDGKLQLQVELKLPAGFKLNPLAPLKYRVEAVGEQSLIAPSALGSFQRVPQPVSPFSISLPTQAAEGQALLKVQVNYFYCSEGKSGICQVGTVVFQVPVQASPEAAQPQVALSYTIPVVAPPDTLEKKTP